MSETLAAPVQGPPPGVPGGSIVTVAQFRADMLPFSDVLIYPDRNVQMFLNVATVMVNPPRWGNLRSYGIELVTAHFLALQQYAIMGARGGGVPGAARGVMSSKSVSKVSVGYDVSASVIEGGGPFNLTTYGQEYLWWCNLLGAGGTEMLGVGYAEAMAGIANTFERGVFIGNTSGGAGGGAIL